MKTILGIWAHPDDEVFTSGGAMAEAVARGDRVVCLHLTRGENGLYHRDPYPEDVLAAVRERELKESLAALGVAEQRFLDYPDGHLQWVERADVIPRLYDAIAEVDPDEIVTFGADGYTGHPDHRSLSAWVTAATRLWNKPKTRLMHAVVPSAWKSTIVPRLDEFEFFWPGHPETYPDAHVTHRLEGEVLDAKVEALRAHASQMEPLFEAYGEDFMREMASIETFRFGPRAAFRSRVLQDMRPR